MKPEDVWTDIHEHHNLFSLETDNKLEMCRVPMNRLQAAFVFAGKRHEYTIQPLNAFSC